MSQIGPTLPPQVLAKRKHESPDQDEESNDSNSRRSSPLQDNSKKRRVIGPVMPPASIEENEDENEDSSSSSSSDDEFGPALPTSKKRSTTTASPPIPSKSSEPIQKPKPHHDDWMLAPPTNADWASRIDPTKLRNRRFNTGRSARAPRQNAGSEGIASIWTETPEQKRKRLEEEVLGTGSAGPGGSVDAGVTRKHKTEEEETRRRVKDFNAKHRGPSLYEIHQMDKTREAADDPSARPFDREKDIAGGMKIGHSKRKELLKRASDFGSRFSRGSYL